MADALLYDKLSSSRVRCNVCQWRCVIGEGKYGVCRARKNNGGVLDVLNYAEAVSIAPDPIEKKPLFHFFPGTPVFSLGTWGCNFHCVHCQNWEISCVEESSALRRSVQKIEPRAAVDMARQFNCEGIAWTYNEPTIWFEYTLDSAKIAKENGLYTVYVTNGYITPEALDMIGPYLDAWRVDVKGFSDNFYRDIAKIRHWSSILDMAVRAQDKWNMHVEVITNIIPTMNDDDEQLKSLAAWIRNSLGELTPWHVTRFYPYYRLEHLPPTPVATLEKAYDIGTSEGLRFVYLGNVPGHNRENTRCYSCGNIVIRRSGYKAHVVGVENSKCSFCGAELNVKMGHAGRN
jgi:pyruvate formate lyase activating enzyme